VILEGKHRKHRAPDPKIEQSGASISTPAGDDQIGLARFITFADGDLPASSPEPRKNRETINPGVTVNILACEQLI